MTTHSSASASAAAGAFADPVAMQKKTILYVGGLADEVDETILAAAFRPFGDIQSVHIPKDAHSQKGRGFGHVEFQDSEDAAAAVENMHDSELAGRVIKCNIAKPGGVRGSVWAAEQAEDWYAGQNKSAEDVDAQIQHQRNQEAKGRQ